MKYHYDPEVDALAIWLHEGPSVESDEVRDGVIFDYDRNKRLVGIEILDASKLLPRSFAKKPMERELVPAV